MRGNALGLLGEHHLLMYLFGTRVADPVIDITVATSCSSQKGLPEDVPNTDLFSTGGARTRPEGDSSKHLIINVLFHLNLRQNGA